MSGKLQTKGIISDIQRASVHDGPGLRTTVFVKGCQIDCPWCHNPETISFEPQEMFYPDKCIGCGLCAEGCFAGARVMAGRSMTVAEVLHEVAQDSPYYGEDGGITVSGGEPLCQPAFTRELLAAVKALGIHTALETNLCVPWHVAEPVLSEADLLMADLKLWDSDEHKKWVGMGNEHVKENLQNADKMGLPIILRTPVVPGVNEDIENILATARFAATLKNLRYYELLAYHPLGLGKSVAIGRDLQRFEKPLKEILDVLAKAAIDATGIDMAINSVPFKG